MARLIIPPNIVDGFKEIAKFNEYQISDLANYLKNLEVGTKFDDIARFLATRLSVENSSVVVRTMISFSELLEPDDIKFDELARDLKESVHQTIPSNEVNLNILESNLIKIFENFKNLKLSVKAFNLLLENPNVYVESKIISDIRLIFNDSITESNRHGVVIHRLQLTVQNNRENSDITISMDTSDLKKLKDDLDRALLKEEIIKEDYEKIHFLNY